MDVLKAVDGASHWFGKSQPRDPPESSVPVVDIGSLESNRDLTADETIDLLTCSLSSLDLDEHAENFRLLLGFSNGFADTSYDPLRLEPDGTHASEPQPAEPDGGRVLSDAVLESILEEPIPLQDHPKRRRRSEPGRKKYRGLLRERADSSRSSKASSGAGNSFDVNGKYSRMLDDISQNSRASQHPPVVDLIGTLMADDESLMALAYSTLSSKGSDSGVDFLTKLGPLDMERNNHGNVSGTSKSGVSDLVAPPKVEVYRDWSKHSEHQQRVERHVSHSFSDDFLKSAKERGRRRLSIVHRLAVPTPALKRTKPNHFNLWPWPLQCSHPAPMSSSCSSRTWLSTLAAALERRSPGISADEESRMRLEAAVYESTGTDSGASFRGPEKIEIIHVEDSFGQNAVFQYGELDGVVFAARDSNNINSHRAPWWKRDEWKERPTEEDAMMNRCVKDGAVIVGQCEHGELPDYVANGAARGHPSGDTSMSSHGSREGKQRSPSKVIKDLLEQGSCEPESSTCDVEVATSHPTYMRTIDIESLETDAVAEVQTARAESSVENLKGVRKELAWIKKSSLDARYLGSSGNPSPSTQRVVLSRCSDSSAKPAPSITTQKDEKVGDLQNDGSDTWRGSKEAVLPDMKGYHRNEWRRSSRDEFLPNTKSTDVVASAGNIDWTGRDRLSFGRGVVQPAKTRRKRKESDTISSNDCHPQPSRADAFLGTPSSPIVTFCEDYVEKAVFDAAPETIKQMSESRSETCTAYFSSVKKGPDKTSKSPHAASRYSGLKGNVDTMESLAPGISSRCGEFSACQATENRPFNVTKLHEHHSDSRRDCYNDKSLMDTECEGISVPIGSTRHGRRDRISSLRGTVHNAKERVANRLSALACKRDVSPDDCLENRIVARSGDMSEGSGILLFKPTINVYGDTSGAEALYSLTKGSQGGVARPSGDRRDSIFQREKSDSERDLDAYQSTQRPRSDRDQAFGPEILNHFKKVDAILCELLAAPTRQHRTKRVERCSEDEDSLEHELEQLARSEKALRDELESVQRMSADRRWQAEFLDIRPSRKLHDPHQSGSVIDLSSLKDSSSPLLSLTKPNSMSTGSTTDTELPPCEHTMISIVERTSSPSSIIDLSGTSTDRVNELCLPSSADCLNVETDEQEDLVGSQGETEVIFVEDSFLSTTSFSFGETTGKAFSSPLSRKVGIWKGKNNDDVSHEAPHQERLAVASEHCFPSPHGKLTSKAILPDEREQSPVARSGVQSSSCGTVASSSSTTGSPATQRGTCSGSDATADSLFLVCGTTLDQVKKLHHGSTRNDARDILDAKSYKLQPSARSLEEIRDSNDPVRSRGDSSGANVVHVEEAAGEFSIEVSISPSTQTTVEKKVERNESPTSCNSSGASNGQGSRWASSTSSCDGQGWIHSYPSNLILEFQETTVPLVASPKSHLRNVDRLNSKFAALPGRAESLTSRRNLESIASNETGQKLSDLRSKFTQGDRELHCSLLVLAHSIEGESGSCCDGPGSRDRSRDSLESIASSEAEQRLEELRRLQKPHREYSLDGGGEEDCSDVSSSIIRSSVESLKREEAWSDNEDQSDQRRHFRSVDRLNLNRPAPSRTFVASPGAGGVASGIHRKSLEASSDAGEELRGFRSNLSQDGDNEMNYRTSMERIMSIEAEQRQKSLRLSLKKHREHHQECAEIDRSDFSLSKIRSSVDCFKREEPLIDLWSDEEGDSDHCRHPPSLYVQVQSVDVPCSLPVSSKLVVNTTGRVKNGRAGCCKVTHPRLANRKPPATSPAEREFFCLKQEAKSSQLRLPRLQSPETGSPKPSTLFASRIRALRRLRRRSSFRTFAEGNSVQTCESPSYDLSSEIPDGSDSIVVAGTRLIRHGYPPAEKIQLKGDVRRVKKIPVRTKKLTSSIPLARGRESRKLTTAVSTAVRTHMLTSAVPGSLLWKTVEGQSAESSIYRINVQYDKTVRL
jgi:hypothetical protein